MFASKDLFFTNSGGYQIQRSARFRSSASAYLNRTPSSAGNRTTWTISFWLKRGLLTGDQVMFAAGAGANGMTCYFESATQTIQWFNRSASVKDGIIITSQVFRDPSSWYHFVFVWNSGNATASNRMQMYVNGVQVTAFSSTTNPALNLNSQWNANTNHELMSDNAPPSSTVDGYLTEVNFIDGQALTPSSFGQTNSVTGVWQPIKYAGTYGTNGFYLNFTSNGTAAALGTDFSGNSNTWTVNNVSVTAGTTYDSMVDSPTNYADGSTGRGNYPVFNPLKIYTGAGSNLVLTDGNLTATNTAAQTGLSIATMRLPSTGKWYWEVTNVAGNGLLNYAGMVITEANADANSATISGNYRSNGAITNIAGTAQTSGATYTAGDVIGVAVDVDAGTVQFYKNNAAQGATPSFTFTVGTILVPTVANDNSAGTKTFAGNFGQRPFSYTPPTGFVALNTQNLPAPSISNGANYMAASTYTGTGATLAISNAVSGISFQPDWVWVKGRSGATDHALYDSVRGTTLDLVSNTTAAETTQTTGLTAFGSAGFTVGALAKMNTNAATYVGWQWKAGTTSSSNTNGSITSTVSVNATAGFSVVTYTGNGIAGATVGHGLGVAPKMMIVKNRDQVGDWCVYHVNMNATPQNYYALLNLTNAATANSTIWNNTAPTSSVFSIGSYLYGNPIKYVAYCFAAVAGYSAFGSYTANASADGPFIYLGFRPRFILFKRITSATNWYIVDTSIEAYNAGTTGLYPNTSAAESTEGALDILSNGFKCRASSGAFNFPNGETFIYAAFAENPFKNSLAR